MNELTNKYALVFFSGVLSSISLYIESRVTSNPRPRNDYLKLFLLVSILVFLVFSVDILVNEGKQDVLLGKPNF